MSEKTTYLKEYAKRLNIIVEKIEGVNKEDITLEERDVMREIYSRFCREERLVVEEN